MGTYYIGSVVGYPEDTEKSIWRKTNDLYFIEAVKAYNKKYKLKEGDESFWTPHLLKCQAMIESGGSKQHFLTDPLQVNNPGDWVNRKRKVLGLEKNEEMTPFKSAVAALEWMRYKGWKHNALGRITTYRGKYQALRRYNGNKNIYSYHQGIQHRDYYANKIIVLSEIPQ